jgi:hypothetical protein
MGPGEERDDRARGSGIIPEIEVVSSRIVEVYGLLDETQPQHIGIEIQVPLRVAGDSRHVVQAYDRFGWHRLNSFATIRFDIELKDSSLPDLFARVTFIFLRR